MTFSEALTIRPAPDVKAFGPQRNCHMANSRSAKKSIRQIARRTAVNRNRVGRIRTFMKKVEQAIESGDKDAANLAFREAQPEIHRGVTKGVMHKNTAARRLSGLSRRIRAL